MKTITIAIPTMGRDTLKHTLDSIKRQALIQGDRVLVVLDTLAAKPSAELTALVDSYGPPFELHYHAGGPSFYGNPQFNYAMTLADTEYFCGLGDDDVYVDGAIERLRKSLRPGRATLYQFYSPPFDTREGPMRFVLWSEPELRVANISGCCIACPVESLVAVRPEPRREVDFDWIVNCVNQTGKKPIWLNDCLIIANPDLRNGQPVHKGITRCDSCVLVHYLEDIRFGCCPECVEACA